MFQAVYMCVFSERYTTAVTWVETNTSPISGRTISLFCNVTLLDAEDPGFGLKYDWFRDDTPLVDRDTYFGLDTIQINITVSSKL